VTAAVEKGMVRCLALAIVLSTAAAAPAHAQTFDPAYRFRELPTTHFIIYFHQGEDRLAGRLAAIAEDTWRRLQSSFDVPPPARTHVVLVDQTDVANGYATPIPRDTIAIYAAWPAGSDLLRVDDWLRVVFTHEFTHIVHLDRSEGWARLARGVFGRIPLAFPNLFLPGWQIEGLAVYEESVVTGSGRLHAGDFRAIVDEQARARRLEPLDRINGGLTAWPGGLAQYAYGLGFHAYLAETYGAEKLGTLAHDTARSLPFLSSRAFAKVYGKPLGTLFREYEAGLRASIPAGEATDGATRLTHHDYTVSGPRFAPACPGCPPEIYYSVVDADALPALYRLRLDGADAVPRRVATRYFGSTSAPGRQVVYFDQQEIHRNAGVYGDIYALDRTGGGVRPVTKNARLLDPDLSPDEQTLAAVQGQPGRRDLVLVRLTPAGPTVTALVSEADTQFNAPRWSPDGRSIAVERQATGGQPEIAVVDVASGATRIVGAGDRMRWVTPTWRRDGAAIVAAADVGDGPFNLYEIELSSGRPRQLTHTSGGATWPDVSPDGTAIVYVGYLATGFDVFEMPYPGTSGAAPDAPAEPRSGAAVDPIPPPADPTGARAYSPWATLRPTAWSPLVTFTDQRARAGAIVSGADVLGYHFYSASATWALSRPADAPPGRRAVPDWTLSYTYARWPAQIFTSGSRQTSFFAGPPAAGGLPSTATLERYEVEAGVAVRATRFRRSQLGYVSFVRAADDYTLASGPLALRRAGVRVAWAVSTAHVFGNSISAERGVSAGATAELDRRALGSDGDATTVTGDARAYLPGAAAHHVIALRLGGGATTGNLSLGRVFLLGGGAGDPNVISVGSSAFSLLRGFAPNTFAGRRVLVLNVDYRVPIARLERGVGTWPLFVHTIHGAIFADVAGVWTHAWSARDLKTSIGAELAANLVLGYRLPLTVVMGAAYGRDGSHLVAAGAILYARIGYAF